MQEFEGHNGGPTQQQRSCGATHMAPPWKSVDSRPHHKENMLVNIHMLQDEEAVCVHYNSGVKVVNQAGDLHVYRNVW